MTDNLCENSPFASFGLSENMLAAITRKGWPAPTSIQSIALPRLLADEGHLIIKARTGTGKTAAFGIPLIEKITTAGRAPRALILTPTRELALQVSKEISSLVNAAYPRVTAVYGGASIRTQILDLRRGTEIVVGTPGRVMDLQERKALDLSAVDWFILDEADEMLDMGFFEDVEKILALVKPAAVSRNAAEPADENTGDNNPVRHFHIGLFSATMPDAILQVIRKHIGKAEILEDTAPEDEKPAVDQYYTVVKREDKLEALRRIIDQAAIFYGVIFCATKAETDELARRLVEAGYPAEAIHGDLSQEIRERTLRRFRLHRAALEKGAAILTATDVAARGLDIEGLTHVINWDLPNDRETYVHRIGRTGRAGRRGIAITLAQPGERGRMSQLSRSMEKTLGNSIAWLAIPSVKSVMKAIRRRIASLVTAALPEQETVTAESAIQETAAAEMTQNEAEQGALGETVQAEAAPEKIERAEISAAEIIQSPFLAKLHRELIEKMGAEKALAAMVTLNYGAQLDPARYGPIAEFSQNDFHEPARGRADHGRKRDGRFNSAPAGRGGFKAGRHPRAGYRDEAGTGAQDVARVYVGIGRRHGAGARDVAKLLSRAGGVPGRQVDDIEMQEYGAFATLPSDAARRACAFSRNGPDDPVIKPARS